MGYLAETGEATRNEPVGGDPAIRNEDRSVADPVQTPNQRQDPSESAGPAGWVHALNSFLERAFTEADRATGC
jgi:hypothetical protein